jgi:hypothetical protein
MPADVVRADHDDRRFGLELVDLMAIGNAPKNVAGLVAADAEVHRLEGAEVFLPGLLAFPAVCDGITEEDDVPRALAFLDTFKEVLVARDVAVEFLDGRIVAFRMGINSASTQPAVIVRYIVVLLCVRASPWALPGILSNHWLG